jgi:hypothetical protein
VPVTTRLAPLKQLAIEMRDAVRLDLKPLANRSWIIITERTRSA